MTVERIFLAKAEMKDNIQIRATASYCAIYRTDYNSGRGSYSLFT